MMEQMSEVPLDLRLQCGETVDMDTVLRALRQGRGRVFYRIVNDTMDIRGELFGGLRLTVQPGLRLYYRTDTSPAAEAWLRGGP